MHLHYVLLDTVVDTAFWTQFLDSFFGFCFGPCSLIFCSLPFLTHTTCFLYYIIFCVAHATPIIDNIYLRNAGIYYLCSNAPLHTCCATAHILSMLQCHTYQPTDNLFMFYLMFAYARHTRAPIYSPVRMRSNGNSKEKASSWREKWQIRILSRKTSPP